MAVVNPNQQQIPKLDTPFTEGDSRVLSLPWQKFLTSLWQRSGGGQAATSSVVYFQITPTGVLQAYRSSDGALIGSVPTTGGGGAPAVVQVLGVSPFIFTASQSGTLVINQGQVEISRDGGVTYYSLGVLGGSPHILAGDKIRITWFTSSLPSVVFFGDIGI